MVDLCAMCNESVVVDPSSTVIQTDEGPRKMHRVCGLREVVGGIGHLLDHDHFCRNMGSPDAGLDYFTSALMVDVWVQRKGVPNVDGERKEG
jgi:hypothetical protein